MWDLIDVKRVITPLVLFGHFRPKKKCQVNDQVKSPLFI